MARSLRSQSKKRFRAIKRENVFKPVDDARLARLAEAQAKAAEKPKVGDHMEEEKLENDSMMDTTDESKKISTSGARNNKVARKLRKKKAKKANKPKSTKNLF